MLIKSEKHKWICYDCGSSAGKAFLNTVTGTRYISGQQCPRATSASGADFTAEIYFIPNITVGSARVRKRSRVPKRGRHLRLNKGQVLPLWKR